MHSTWEQGGRSSRLPWWGHVRRLTVLLLLTALGAAVVELGGWQGWPRSILVVLAASLTGGILGVLTGVPPRLAVFVVFLVAATIASMRWGEAYLGWPGIFLGGLAAYLACHWLARIPLSFLGSFLLLNEMPGQQVNPPRIPPSPTPGHDQQPGPDA